MSDVIYKVNLIKSDPVNNNNKFWRGTLSSNGDVLCEWGRVGDTGQSKTFPGAGRSFLDKKVAEKKRAGRNGEIEYRELDLVEADVPVTKSQAQVSTKDASLHKIASEQIKTNSTEAAKLIEYLVKVNAHQITQWTGGQITYNFETGLFQTPLGLVSQNSIDKARKALDDIADCVVGKDYGNRLLELTRDYLMLVPQEIGRRRLETQEFWSDLTKVHKQNSILDGLAASLTKATTPNSNDKNPVPQEKVFNTKLEVISDSKLISKLFDGYYRDRSQMHQCFHLKPKSAWNVTIESMREGFEKDGAKMSGLIEGYHSSSASNILSIMKSGLCVPPASSPHVTYRLFGDGVYTAPVGVKGASTKSLGYGYGVWGGNIQKRFFMFVCDVAMGKHFVPPATNYENIKNNPRGISYPVKGTESTWAKGGNGVKNDECIVYRTGQINIKHLIEFEE